MRLANKLAAVTAAASGMGRAGVELFLKEGARVAESRMELFRRVRHKGGGFVCTADELSEFRNEIHRTVQHPLSRLKNKVET